MPSHTTEHTGCHVPDLALSFVFHNVFGQAKSSTPFVTFSTEIYTYVDLFLFILRSLSPSKYGFYYYIMALVMTEIV